MAQYPGVLEKGLGALKGMQVGAADAYPPDPDDGLSGAQGRLLSLAIFKMSRGITN
jgi:hypothetical protein